MFVESVSYLALLTQQSSSLTARMHHNSQKRINTSKLFGDLGDLTLTQQSHKHLSASLQQLCVLNTADSAVQKTPGTQILSHSVFFFLVFVFTFVAHARTCQLYCINAASVSPSSFPTSYLQRFIKDYLTIYIHQYHQWR